MEGPTNSWHSLLTKHRQVAAVSKRPLTLCLTVISSRHSIPLAFKGVFSTGSGTTLPQDFSLSWLDGHLSSAVPVTSGVPQGSILGPLLFNIYMNSISKLQLSPNARLVLYADDILLFKPIDNAKDKEDLQK